MVKEDAVHLPGRRGTIVTGTVHQRIRRGLQMEMEGELEECSWYI